MMLGIFVDTHCIAWQEVLSAGCVDLKTLAHPLYSANLISTNTIYNKIVSQLKLYGIGSVIDWQGQVFTMVFGNMLLELQSSRFSRTVNSFTPLVTT